MFASQHNLNNLVAIIDYNKLQAIDFVEKVISLEPFKLKWESFGWQVKVVDGHSFEEILTVFKELKIKEVQKPTVVIAMTTKGKGVSLMENKPIWHFRVPNRKETKIFHREIEKL
jgi:transketolase